VRSSDAPSEECAHSAGGAKVGGKGGRKERGGGGETRRLKIEPLEGDDGLLRVVIQYSRLQKGGGGGKKRTVLRLLPCL